MYVFVHIIYIYIYTLIQSSVEYITCLKKTYMVCARKSTYVWKKVDISYKIIELIKTGFWPWCKQWNNSITKGPTFLPRKHQLGFLCSKLRVLGFWKSSNPRYHKKLAAILRQTGAGSPWHCAWLQMRLALQSHKLYSIKTQAKIWALRISKPCAHKAEGSTKRN